MLAYSLIHVGLFVCFHINLYRVPKLKSYVMPHPAAKLDKSTKIFPTTNQTNQLFLEDIIY